MVDEDKNDPRVGGQDGFEWAVDWLTESAQTFGNNTAINIHGEFGGAPPEDMVVEAELMMVAAFAAKLNFRGCPEDMIAPACRQADLAYLDMIDRLLADATPGVVH